VTHYITFVILWKPWASPPLQPSPRQEETNT
jgi:hypothetical protein